MTGSEEARRPAPGPLAGVRVLDLTTMMAGPYATMILADLGADVVKVEPPHGDITRTVGPLRPSDAADALGGYFQSVNRGKCSIVLNLKDDADRETFLNLVRDADLLVENYSAGVMERLGVPYERLRAVNPRLVYGAIRGFGDPRSGQSPYQDWPAVDVIAQAVSGFLSITGTANGTPIKSGPGIGDIFPAVLATIGILAALRHAERTGEGQFVDVALYDAMVALCERIIYQYSYTGQVPVPQGNAHPLFSPFDIMPTKDGWVAVAVAAQRQWEILVKAIGHPELALDKEYDGHPARVKHRREIRAMLEEWLGDRTTAEVMEAVGGRVPIGPVNTAADLFSDPHLAMRDMLASVEQPGSDEPVMIAGTPIKLSRTPARVRGRGPKLGEQSAADVLARWRRTDLHPTNESGAQR